MTGYYRFNELLLLSTMHTFYIILCPESQSIYLLRTGLGYWFYRETFTYIRAYGGILSPKALSAHVTDIIFSHELIRLLL